MTATLSPSRRATAVTAASSSASGNRWVTSLPTSRAPLDSSSTARLTSARLLGHLRQVHDLVVVDELQQVRRVVGEDVGGVARGQLRGERLPVLPPRRLGDLHGDARVGRVEVVGALLVEGRLAVVPQPVVDGDAVGAGFPSGGRGGVRVAGGQGRGHERREADTGYGAGFHGIPSGRGTGPI